MKKVILSLMCSILLFTCTLVSACGTDYSKISINVTQDGEEITELELFMNDDGVTGDSEQFKVWLKGMDDISLYFYLQNDEIAKVELNQKSDKEYEVVVTPIKVGQAKVTFCLAEDSTIKKDVIIKVSQPVQKIEIDADFVYYAQRGVSTALNLGDKLKVYPANASLSDVKYEIVGITAQEVGFNVSLSSNGVLDAAKSTGCGEIVVKVYINDSICDTFKVVVIDAVQESKIKLTYTYGDGKELSLFRSGAKQRETIELIKTGAINAQTEYLKDYNRVKIQCGVVDGNALEYSYQYKLEGDSASSVFQNGKWYMAENNSFEIYALQLGVTHLTLRINNKGAESFDNFYVEIEFDISVIDAPVEIELSDPTTKGAKNITYNTEDEEFTCNIYDNYAEGTLGQALMFTVKPASVSEDNAMLVISPGNSTLDRNAFYDKVVFYDSEGFVLTPDFNGEIKIKANEIIYARGKTSEVAYEPEYSVKVYSQFSKSFLSSDTEAVSTTVNFVIYQGIRTFTLSDESEPTLYLNCSTLNKYEGENSANITIYIGGLNVNTSAITYEIENSSVARIVNVSADNLTYTIKAVDEGESFVRFYSGNGYTISVHVTTFYPIEKYRIQTPNEFENGYIGERIFNDGVLEKIVVQKNGHFQYDIILNDGGKATVQEISLTSSNPTIAKVNESTKTISVIGTGVVKIEGHILGYTKDGPALIKNGTDIYFSFFVEGYIPVESLELSTNKIVLKDPSTIAYDKQYAFCKATVSAIIQPTNATINMESPDWLKWVVNYGGYEDVDVVSSNYSTTITAFRIASVDVNSVSFTLSVTLTLYGRTFIANCDVIIEKAIKVQKLYLQNVPYSQITFDARKGLNETNNSFAINTKVSPTNAFDTSLRYDIIDDGSDETNNKPVFKITNNVVTPLRGGIGVLRIAPQDSFTTSEDCDESLCKYVTIIVQDGTSEQTAYSIENVTDLKNINKDVNTLGYFYKLTNDIDLSSISAWTPISKFTGWFSGADKIYKYDEENREYVIDKTIQHTISSLNLNASQLNLNASQLNKTSYFGLFGQVTGKGLQDVKLENVKVSIDLHNEDNTYVFYFGVLAGSVGKYSKIENCFVQISSFSFKINAQKGSTNVVGGLVGEANNALLLNNRLIFNPTLSGSAMTISYINEEGNATGDNDATSDRNLYFGGLVGKFVMDKYEVTIEENSVTINTLSSPFIVGNNGMGFVPYNESGNEINYVANYNNNGYDVYIPKMEVSSVKSLNECFVGGLVGYTVVVNNNLQVMNLSYNVSELGRKYYADIADVAVYADIKTSCLSSVNAGGLVGENEVNISNVYFDGSVQINGNSNNNVGGIAGKNSGYISFAQVYTYENIGVISGQGNIGGLVGDNLEKSVILYSYVSGLNGQEAVTGIGYIGALIGNANNSAVVGCYTDIQTNTNTDTNNFIGNINNTVVKYCYSINSSMSATATCSYQAVKNNGDVYEVTFMGDEITSVETLINGSDDTFILPNNINATYTNINNSFPIIKYQTLQGDCQNNYYIYNVVYTNMIVIPYSITDRTSIIQDSEEEKAILAFYYSLDSSYEITLNDSEKVFARQKMLELNTYSLSSLFSLEVQPVPFTNISIQLTCTTLAGDVTNYIYLNENNGIVVTRPGTYKIVLTSKINPSLRKEVKLVVIDYISKFGLYKTNSSESIEYSISNKLEMRKGSVEDVYVIYNALLNIDDNEYLLNVPSNVGTKYTYNYNEDVSELVSVVDEQEDTSENTLLFALGEDVTPTQVGETDNYKFVVDETTYYLIKHENKYYLSENDVYDANDTLTSWESGDYFFGCVSANAEIRCSRDGSYSENSINVQYSYVKYNNFLTIGSMEEVDNNSNVEVEYYFELEIDGVKFISSPVSKLTEGTLIWSVFENVNNKDVDIRADGKRITIAGMFYYAVDCGKGIANVLFAYVGQVSTSNQVGHYNARLKQLVVYENDSSIIPISAEIKTSGEIIVSPYVNVELENNNTTRVELQYSKVSPKILNFETYEGAESITSNLNSVEYSPSDAINLEVYLLSDTTLDDIEFIQKVKVINDEQEQFEVSTNLNIVVEKLETVGADNLNPHKKFKTTYRVTITLDSSYDARFLTEKTTYLVQFCSTLLPSTSLDININYYPQQLQRLDVVNHQVYRDENNSELIQDASTDNKVALKLKNENHYTYVSAQSNSVIDINMYPAYAEADSIRISSDVQEGSYISFNQLYKNNEYYIFVGENEQYFDNGRTLELKRLKKYNFDGHFYVRSYLGNAVSAGTIFTITIQALKYNAYTQQYDVILETTMKLEVTGAPRAEINAGNNFYSYITEENGIEKTNYFVITGTKTTLKTILTNVENLDIDSVELNAELTNVDTDINKLKFVESYGQSVAIVPGGYEVTFNVYVGPGVPEGAEIIFNVKYSYFNEGGKAIGETTFNAFVVRYLIDKINLSSPFSSATDYVNFNLYEENLITVSSVEINSLISSKTLIPSSYYMLNDKLFDALTNYGGWYNGTNLYTVQLDNNGYYVKIAGYTYEKDNETYTFDVTVTFDLESSFNNAGHYQITGASIENNSNAIITFDENFNIFISLGESDNDKITISILNSSEFVAGNKSIEESIRRTCATQLLSTNALNFNIKLQAQNSEEYKTIATDSDTDAIVKYVKNSATSKVCLKAQLMSKGNKIKMYCNYEPTGANGLQVEYTREYSVIIENLTSLEAPEEVDSQEAFEKMESGKDYILMKNITLVNYTPMDADFASFNGNNYVITIKSFSTETLTASSVRLGIFNNVSKGTLIKNMIVDVYNLKQLNLSTASSVNIGLLAVTNNGIITNSQVMTTLNNSNTLNGTEIFTINGKNVNDSNGYSGFQTITILTPANVSISQISAFVSVNNGSITHSRVGSDGGIVLKLCASGEVAGFVNVNSGTIASCFVVNLTIENIVNVIKEGITAGFAGSNNGKIIQSFVRNETNNSRYVSNVGYLKSNAVVAGFVYKNQGEIKDCYSNLTLSSTAGTAGFVYSNGSRATIDTSYSACLLVSNSDVNMPFVGVDALSNVLNENSEGINNCYFLVAQSGEYIVDENDYPAMAIQLSRFGKGSSFGGFSFGETLEIVENGKKETYMPSEESVWYMGSQGPTIFSAENIATEVQQTVSYGDNGKVFLYPQVSDDKYYEVGNQKNPIIISNAEEFNYYLYKNSTGVNGDGNLRILENKYIRILNDIDFNDVNGEIVSTEMALINCNIEGNGFTLKNVVLNSTNTIGTTNCLGLFALVMASNIRNLNVEIIQASCESVRVLGGLAGVVYNSNISSVNVTSSAIMSARFVAGGIFGAVFGVSTLQDISASASININYKSATDNKPKEYITGSLKFGGGTTYNEVFKAISGITDISYVGGAIGILDLCFESNLAKKTEQEATPEKIIESDEYIARMSIGGETVSNIKVLEATKLSGQFVGGVVGYVGQYSHISNAVFELLYNDQTEQYLETEYCVGGIVGVNYGMVSRSAVKHSNYYEDLCEQEIYTYLTTGTDARHGKTNLFKGNLNVAGGIVGINYYGILRHCYSTVNVEDNKASTISEQYLGGIVGLTYLGQFENIYVTGNVYSKNNTAYMGGVIGRYNAIKGSSSGYGDNIKDIYCLNLWSNEALNLFKQNATSNRIGIFVGYAYQIGTTTPTQNEGNIYIVHNITINNESKTENALYNIESSNLNVKWSGTDSNNIFKLADIQIGAEFTYDKMFTDSDLSKVDTFFQALISNTEIWHALTFGKLPRLNISSISSEEDIYHIFDFLAKIQKYPYKTLIIQNDIDFDITKYKIKKVDYYTYENTTTVKPTQIEETDNYTFEIDTDRYYLIKHENKYYLSTETAYSVGAQETSWDAGAPYNYTRNVTQEAGDAYYLCYNDNAIVSDGIPITFDTLGDLTYGGVNLSEGLKWSVANNELTFSSLNLTKFISGTFTGKLQGATEEGKELQNIKLSNNRGFFDVLRKSSIANLTFKFKPISITALGPFGLIAQQDFSSSFNNVHVEVEENNEENNTFKAQNFGGFIGQSTGTTVISKCSITGKFKLNSNQGSMVNVGGFVGSADAITIQNCTAHVTFSHTNGSDSYTIKIGGFVGVASIVNIKVEGNGTNELTDYGYNDENSPKYWLEFGANTNNDCRVEGSCGGIIGEIKSSGTINRVDILAGMKIEDATIVNAGLVAGKSKNTIFSNINIGENVILTATTSKTQNNTQLNVGGLSGNAQVSSLNSEIKTDTIILNSVTLSVEVNEQAVLNVGGIFGKFFVSANKTYTNQNIKYYGDIIITDNTTNSTINAGGIIGYNECGSTSGSVNPINFTNVQSYVDITVKNENYYLSEDNTYDENDRETQWIPTTYTFNNTTVIPTQVEGTNNYSFKIDDNTYYLIKHENEYYLSNDDAYDANDTQTEWTPATYIFNNTTVIPTQVNGTNNYSFKIGDTTYYLVKSVGVLGVSVGGFLGSNSPIDDSAHPGKLNVSKVFVGGVIDVTKCNAQSSNIGGFAGLYYGKLSNADITTSLLVGTNKVTDKHNVNAICAYANSSTLGDNVVIVDGLVGTYINDNMGDNNYKYTTISYETYLDLFEPNNTQLEDYRIKEENTYWKITDSIFNPLKAEGGLLNPANSLGNYRYVKLSGTLDASESGVDLTSYSNLIVLDVNKKATTIGGNKTLFANIPNTVIVSNIVLNLTNATKGALCVGDVAGSVLGVYAKGTSTSNCALVDGNVTGLMLDVMLDVNSSIADGATYAFIANEICGAYISNVQLLGNVQTANGINDGDPTINAIAMQSSGTSYIANVTIAPNICAEQYELRVTPNNTNNKYKDIKFNNEEQKYYSEVEAGQNAIYQKYYCLYDCYTSNDNKSGAKVESTKNYAYAYISRFSNQVVSTTENEENYANNYARLKYLIDNNKNAKLLYNINRASASGNTEFKYCYSGTLNGNNNGIYGISMSQNGVFVDGLGSCTIQNITFEFNSLSETYDKGEIGTLARTANSTNLNNVIVTMNAKKNYIYGHKVGGIVGSANSCTFTNVTTSNLEVVANSGSDPGSAGGFVGYAEWCTFSGTNTSGTLVIGGNGYENGGDAGPVGGFVGTGVEGLYAGTFTLNAYVVTGDAGNGANGQNGEYVGGNGWHQNTQSKSTGNGGDGGNVYIGGIVGKAYGGNFDKELTAPNVSMLTYKGNSYISSVCTISRLRSDKYAAGRGGNGGTGSDGENHKHGSMCKPWLSRDECDDNVGSGYKGGNGGNGGKTYIGTLFGGYYNNNGITFKTNLGTVGNFHCSPGGDGGAGGKGGEGDSFDIHLGFDTVQYWHRGKSGGYSGFCGYNGNGKNYYQNTKERKYRDSESRDDGAPRSISPSDAYCYLQS